MQCMDLSGLSVASCVPDRLRALKANMKSNKRLESIELRGVTLSPRDVRVLCEVLSCG
jgi:hypothetical protein